MYTSLNQNLTTTDFSKIFTERNLNEFLENGSTIVDNVATGEQLDQLIERSSYIMKNNDIFEKRVAFSRGEVDFAKNIISSSDQIGFFFEPNIFDKDNNLLVPEDQVLNKMGHAMHDIDPVFERFTYRPLIQFILKQLGYQKPKCVQSMYIFKNPRIGTPVAPHTDNMYLITEPQSSVLGCWFALHDATIENGCLWGIQGSHKSRTTQIMHRNETDDKLYYVGEQKKYDMSEFTPLEVKRGQCFVFHGDYVHTSKHNTSDKPRHAYTMHFIDSLGHEWHQKNWLQRRPHLPFRDYDTVVSQLYPNLQSI